VLRTTRGYRLPSLRDAFTPEAREWVRQQWDKAITQGDEDVAAPSPGIGIELPQEIDSDADGDPDTDVCAEGSRPGSSPFLTVSSRHGANGEQSRDRDGFR
jgi:hypothetical protein